MHCPRLDHFVRLERNGKIGKCGHMVKAKFFDTFEDMQTSDWLGKIKDTMQNDEWPIECIRCQKTESIDGRSIRLDMIQRDKLLKPIDKNYIIVGGVLDNVCNSACQTCNSNLSTKIGSLQGKNYVKIQNMETYKKIPMDKILELDVNGGEPTVSPAYRKLLSELPPNVKIIRINTNGYKPFKLIENLLKKKIRIILTVSFDGTGKIHDYVRWPVEFEKIDTTIKYYQKLLKTYDKLLRLNLWTTVSCLNVSDFDNILSYAKENKIEHSFALLEQPGVLCVTNTNRLTVDAKIKFIDHPNKILSNLSKKIAVGGKNSSELTEFITNQDKLRKINFKDYFNLCAQNL